MIEPLLSVRYPEKRYLGRNGVKVVLNISYYLAFPWIAPFSLMCFDRWSNLANKQRIPADQSNRLTIVLLTCLSVLMALKEVL